MPLIPICQQVICSYHNSVRQPTHILGPKCHVCILNQPPGCCLYTWDQLGSTCANQCLVLLHHTVVWAWIILSTITSKNSPSYHYDDVIMGAIASQITSLTIVYSTVYSGADQSKHQSSASLAFVWGIHRGPVNCPHKWPVTRKMFPFDDVIMAMQCTAPIVSVVSKVWNWKYCLFKKIIIEFCNLKHFMIMRTRDYGDLSYSHAADMS